MPGKRLNIAFSFGKVIYASFLLWLISKKPIHGYELIKLLKTESGFSNLGPGHVYPLLRELKTRGYLRSSSQKGGRKKLSYSITSSGKKQLAFLRSIVYQKGLRSEYFKEMIS